MHVLIFIVLAIISLPLLLISLVYVDHLAKRFKYRHIPGPVQFLPPDIAKHLTKYFNFPLLEGERIMTPQNLLRLHEEYNTNVIKVIILNICLVIFIDPEFLKFLAGKGHKILRKTGGFNEELLEMFGNNVFSESNEEEWKRHRTVLNMAFTPDSMEKVVQESCKEMKERVFKLLDNKIERNSFEDMSHVTLDILGKAGFYEDFDVFGFKGKENVKISDLINEWATLQPYYGVFPKWLRKKRFGVLKRLWEINDWYKIFINGIVTKRKNEIENSVDDIPENSLITLIIKGSQQEMSKEEVTANGIAFFFAGHETTAKALGFSLFSLAENQDKQQEMYESVKDINDDLSYKDFEDGKLLYAEAVFKEALRLYPTVSGTTRENHGAFDWEGYHIPDRTFIVPTWSASHINPKYWKEPSKFIPERFIPGSDQEEKIKPFAYAPFGIGPRSCIGRKFAEVESAVVLALLVKHYKIKLADKNYKMDAIQVMTTRPKEYPTIIFEKRE